MTNLIKISLLTICIFFSGILDADYQEEIVVTGTRLNIAGNTASAGPIVFTTQGDYLLQEINLVNDALEADERKQDLQKTFKSLLEKADSNKKIKLSRGSTRIYAVEKESDFELLYQDQNRKGSLRIILKVNLKDRSKNDKLESIFKNFTNSVVLAGRTQIFDYGDERISIVNPRQYRKQLITAITKDISHITKSLGDDYRVILEGLDNNMTWQRQGEDNVTFTLPYSFKVIPENINTISSDY